MDVNILIVGVGGQGTLLASRILGQIAALQNQDCKLSEVHGMAQRGGSVVTHVKIAGKVNTPIIGIKEADVILAFEQLEALRYIDYLKKDGVMIVNTQKIAPMPVIIGAREYPEDILEEIKKTTKKTLMFDVVAEAEKLGNIKAVNVIMIGALVKMMGIDFEVAKEAIRQTVKPKFIDLNLKALEVGYNYGENK